MRQRANGADGEMPAVPITVRQLEAIVRISESLARMQLQVDVTEAHVQQAMDLFKTSTMDAVRAGATEGMVSAVVVMLLLFETRRSLGHESICHSAHTKADAYAAQFCTEYSQYHCRC